jgi:ABC-type uncharacterized transport system substrate-binding protein
MATCIGRRKFIAALAGGLAISRSIAEAEPVAKVYRVGFLLGATGESVASLFHALKEGLRELGYVEGRNIAFVQRYADGRMERLPDLAAELVRLKVDVIVTGTNLHVAAVRHATSRRSKVMFAKVLSKPDPFIVFEFAKIKTLSGSPSAPFRFGSAPWSSIALEA